MLESQRGKGHGQDEIQGTSEWVDARKEGLKQGVGIEEGRRNEERKKEGGGK